MIVFDIDHHHLFMRFFFSFSSSSSLYVCVKTKIRIDVKYMKMKSQHESFSSFYNWSWWINSLCILEEKALDQKNEHAWLPYVDFLSFIFLTIILTSVEVCLEWTIVWFPNERNRLLKRKRKEKVKWWQTMMKMMMIMSSQERFVRDHRIFKLFSSCNYLDIPSSF